MEESNPQRVVVIVATLAEDYEGKTLDDVAWATERYPLTEVTIYACVDDLLAELHEGFEPQEYSNAVVPRHRDDPCAMPDIEYAHPEQRMKFHPER